VAALAAWVSLGAARAEVGDQAGVPVYAYPGLLAGHAGAAVRLYRTPEEADAATAGGLARLIEQQLSRDLGWLERDLRALRQLGTLTVPVAPLEQLQDDAVATLRRWLCDRAVAPLTEKQFADVVGQARADLRGLVPRLVALLREILALRQELLTHAEPYSGLAREVVALVPPDFLRTTPYPQLAHFPRYLKAMKQRADRWRQNPAKEAERAKALAPFAAKAAKLSRLDRRFWLVEEFRVSVFAQELGTAETVSAVKLERELAGGGRGTLDNCRAGTPIPAVPASESGRAERPISTQSTHENVERRDSADSTSSRQAMPPDNEDHAVSAVKKSAPAKKSTPLKSLGALDALLRKS